ncbi:MAG: Crp/Fnr family transcriptional regulator [Alphaproteobacteria bacterium]|nr:Crp/Fnr family transcriptional regulator [Alphaproteobacteria bacterium]
MTIEFPPPRPQIQDRLEAGDVTLGRIMPARSRRMKAHEVLIKAGEPHGEIYRLTSGWLARSRTLSDGRQQIIMVFLPGDLLGLKTMLFDRQPDSIQCLAPATLQILDHGQALELARTDPDVSLRFMWQLAEDERRLHNWVICLGRGNAVERIATLMLDFRGRLLQAGMAEGDSFNLPLTQEQLGEHLGLTIVHVNRILRRLREAGILTVNRGLVEIHDVDALSLYAAPMQDIFERESKSFGGGLSNGASFT